MAKQEYSAFEPTLYNGARNYGIEIDDIKLSMFETYYRLLSEWNRKINLVSERDMSRFVEYHLLDSLKIASCFDMLSIRRMLDFGSGAGLPGIPLSIVFPHIETLLVDSRKKRISFLTVALQSLPGLHANVLRSRVEDLPVRYHGYFDMVVTRATVKLKTFFHYTHLYIHTGGSLVAIKGDSVEDEIIELKNSSDFELFNIIKKTPAGVKNVRKGTIINISRT